MLDKLKSRYASYKEGKENAERIENFDATKALNNAKFVAFLEVVSGSENWDFNTDEGKLEGSHALEAFEAKEKTVVNLSRLYKEEILKNVGIDFPPEVLVEVDKFLSEQVVADPESLVQFEKEFEEFRELSKKLEEAEKEFKTAGGLKNIESIHETLETVRGTQGFFNKKNSTLAGRYFRGGGEKEARKRLRDEYKIGLGETKGKLKNVEELREKIARIGELRIKFFKEFAPGLDVTKLAQQKAQEKLVSMGDIFNPDLTLEDLEKQREYYEKLSSESYKEAPNYLEGMENAGDAMEQLTNYVAERDIRSAIQNTDIGSAPLKALEQSLKKFIKENKVVKKVGNKEGEDAKQFIYETLQRVRATQPKGKRIVLNFLMSRLDMAS